MIELLKIIHNKYDIRVTPALEFNNRGPTRGNKYKLLNNNFHYDVRKYSFTARVVNIWNSLPDYVVDIHYVNVILNLVWTNFGWINQLCLIGKQT